MVEIIAFLANPNSQDRVSHCGELNYSANNEMNGYYYGYPSLSYQIDEH